jgi:hypothetical protein
MTTASDIELTSGVVLLNRSSDGRLVVRINREGVALKRADAIALAYQILDWSGVIYADVPGRTVLFDNE